MTTLLLAFLLADWTITVRPIKPLKASIDAPVRVRIADSKGVPVSGANVELVLTMIDMDHGETKVATKPGKQAGTYEGSPNFMMAGGWNIEVRAKKGADSASKKFKFDVRE